jgi:hypothetical protein
MGAGSGWAWSQIIRPRESLALYKSFNTLWAHSSPPVKLIVVQVSVLLAVLLCALFSVEAAPAPAPAPTIGLAGLGLLGLGGLVFLKGQ